MSKQKEKSDGTRTEPTENDGDDSITIKEIASNGESSKSPVSIIKSKPNSNFATLQTVTSSSEDEENRQAYYAGGSESSGQQVLGPPKKPNVAADIIRSIQEHGLVIVDQSSTIPKSEAFKGTGYKLGQDDTDTVITSEISAPSEVTLRLWQNGFSINDGDLRLYADPDSQKFLEDVREGRIPEELIGDVSRIHLSIEDRRTQVFQPKIASITFQGKGYTLGTTATTDVGASEGDEENNEAKAKEQLKLDNSKPTTNLQIRLADGSKLVGQFNQEHSIRAIRDYIQVARPQYQNRTFDLMTSYPSVRLDDAQTIEAAGLINAVIIQRLI